MAVKSGVSLSWGGFDKALGKAAHNFANTQPLMETIGEVLVSGTLQRFQDEEDPDGKKWKPSVRAMETGDKTLSDTGRLQRSIDYAATSDTVMVGTNVVYGRIHQLGGKTGKGHKVDMPARPYLGVSEEDMKEIRGTVEDFLKDALKE